MTTHKRSPKKIKRSFQEAPAVRAADTHRRLVAKLDPRSFTGISSGMAAVVRFILGARPITDPWVTGISVTSDGHVIIELASYEGPLHDESPIDAPDLDGSITLLLRTAGLLPDELDLFSELYTTRTTRHDGGGIKFQLADILGDSPYEAALIHEADAVKKRLKGRRKP